MICLITQHLWERYYRDWTGKLHIIANFWVDIQLNQTQICRFNLTVIEDDVTLTTRQKGVTFERYELFNLIYFISRRCNYLYEIFIETSPIQLKLGLIGGL